MQKDMRQTALYHEAEEIYRTLRQPGNGEIHDAVEIDVSSDGQHAVFSGIFVDKLDGAQPSRICEIALHSGEVRVLTFGPHTDRLPQYTPWPPICRFLV